MAITNTVSSNLFSIHRLFRLFLLLPIRCDKVIEIVTSFLQGAQWLSGRVLDS